ncbi:MAG: hypothetical protein EHM20_00255 [Alphaproteobacteria bacterium]|nr:MAG: hypothetical protein EHM20_00255 [Alphaproteobacteria bacterium]
MNKLVIKIDNNMSLKDLNGLKDDILEIFSGKLSDCFINHLTKEESEYVFVFDEKYGHPINKEDLEKITNDYYLLLEKGGN